MVMTRKQLDVLECGNPDCKDPSHELILHSKCHIGYPTNALLTDDILELQCAKCEKLIFHVAVALGYGDRANIMRVKCEDEKCEKKHYVIVPKCHEAPVWAVYFKKTGVLEIICAECEKLVYNVEVKKE